MKLEVVNHLISLVGKEKELSKIETTLAAFYEHLNGESFENAAVFDNSYDDEIDLGFAYDFDDYTVSEVRKAWKEFKAKH